MIRDKEAAALPVGAGEGRVALADTADAATVLGLADATSGRKIEFLLTSGRGFVVVDVVKPGRVVGLRVGVVADAARESGATERRREPGVLLEVVDRGDGSLLRTPLEGRRLKVAPEVLVVVFVEVDLVVELLTVVIVVVVAAAAGVRLERLRIENVLFRKSGVRCRSRWIKFRAAKASGAGKVAEIFRRAVVRDVSLELLVRLGHEVSTAVVVVVG